MTTKLPRTSIDPADRHDAFPEAPCGTAVLLLAGSSGRVEAQRADLLARHGARVRAIRWFGGTGQRPAPHEVPIEIFVDQLDLLRRDADRVAIFGTSFGAEAALVTASLHPVDATVAVAPSSVVWSGIVDGNWSSHWSLRGTPLPSVGFDPSWSPTTEPPEYRSLYESSLARDPDLTRAAEIRVEGITGPVILVAGGDDRVWPSDRFAAEIQRRRSLHARETTLVTHPEAGHRITLPGETAVHGGVTMGRGGTPSADAALGADAWTAIARALDLRE
ncbi:alpha/beta fold hydrolase [Microbacterium sp. KSW4-16]|uniref:acyl-CoA thioester hydrolase/BAAT C-terminal domain-containing protein n=1 Tax=Microbacterium aurugineum TaxID=2851642 RepID=UPI0020BFF9A1|nr:acyl-CoA thioester hydrolase/BAAT C-terminal domain-containing protein [Microbacterium aurugineum]MCK8467049.1 alpha/beta fold hydrolase [Microbacterium aurugineum]